VKSDLFSWFFIETLSNERVGTAANPLHLLAVWLGARS
jgi:hypothetical protein